MAKSKTWTDDQFKQAVSNSISVAGVLRCLNLSLTGSNYQTVHRYIKIFDLTTHHWTGQHKDKGVSNLTFHRFKAKPLEEILVSQSTYRNTTSLKKRLLKNHLLENKCYMCDLKTEWNKKTLVLILDHINGIPTDNRLLNLRLLCPNCNSQTPTFAGRNRKNSPLKRKCLNCGEKVSQSSKSGYCIHCVQMAR